MTERKDGRIDRREGPDLEDFFAAARAETPQPGGDFLARMEVLALQEQPLARVEPASPAREVRTGAAGGVLRQLREALGGWAGVAGLATACAAGLWIGISPPVGLTDYWNSTAAGLGTLGVDPLGGFDLALLEG